MKKLMSCLFLAALLCFHAALAEESAACKTITAVAAEVNPEHLSSVSVNARIIGYSTDENALTLELIVPEVFDRQEVQSLAAGDAIFTQGQAVTVQTIAEDSGYLVINKGAYEFSEGSVWLYERTDGNYQIANRQDTAWTLIATVKVPVTDSLLFLDYVNPSGGEPLSLPAVHQAAGFLTMMEKEALEGGPGFANHNVYVVFDSIGQLALIQRYYVPWQ